MTKQQILSCSMSLAMLMLLASSLSIQPATAKHSKTSKHSKQCGSKQCGTKECGTKDNCGTKKCDKKDGECKKVRKEMKITLTKSGGIMGMMRVYEIDSKTLTEENAAKLEQLYDASKIFDLTSKTTPGAADLFFYEFKIEDGKRTTDVTFDDMSLPESVRPLLKYLLEFTPVEKKRSTEAT